MLRIGLLSDSVATTLNDSPPSLTSLPLKLLVPQSEYSSFGRSFDRLVVRNGEFTSFLLLSNHFKLINARLSSKGN